MKDIKINKPTIFIDMDGVLADFFHPALEILNNFTGENVTPKRYRDVWGYYQMAELYDLSPVTFYEQLHRCGSRFWEDLPSIYHGIEALHKLARLGDLFDVYVLTSIGVPTGCERFVPAIIQGKLAWARRHLRFPESNIIFTQHKHLLGAKGRMLVDDYLPNIDAFRSAGGKGVLVPDSWIEEITPELGEKITKNIIGKAHSIWEAMNSDNMDNVTRFVALQRAGSGDILPGMYKFVHKGFIKPN